MLDPYPILYRPAFASSGILYPLVRRPPSRVSFHCPVETVGLTTFRMSTLPGGVRLRLCASGTTSARGEIRALLPGHMPFWPKPFSLFGLSIFTTLAQRFTYISHTLQP